MPMSEWCSQTTEYKTTHHVGVAGAELRILYGHLNVENER